MSSYLSRLLDSLRPEIGWSETGGRIIRDPVSGDVIGRTRWIARSDFWQQRPVKLTERRAHLALDKYATGSKLSPLKLAFVRYAKETVCERQFAALHEQDVSRHEDLMERRALMREGAGVPC